MVEEIPAMPVKPKNTAAMASRKNRTAAPNIVVPSFSPNSVKELL
jgi:hypothetical protein